MSAKIKIIDELLPEDVAMLQALYSRSPASVDSHLDKVEEVGSGNFMDRYYVGYGHRSIGDCGTTTMFIEDLYALKNRYPERLQLQFVFSQEDQEFPTFLIFSFDH